MKPFLLLSFRRPHACGALRSPQLADAASDAAMARQLAEQDEVEEDVRLKSQKAAAWQWLMRGAGAELLQPIHMQSSLRRRATTSAASASRFAAQAAHLSQALPRRLYGNDDLARLRIGSAESSHPRSRKLSIDQTSARNSLAFDHSLETPTADKPTELTPPSDRRKMQLHFLRFQKILHKLISSKPNKSLQTPAAAAAISSDSEEERNYHYHHYIHHHHFHHYYPGGAESFVKRVSLTHPPHLSAVDRPRRRYSESSSHPLAQQHYLYAESGADNEEIDEYQTEFSIDQENSLWMVSKHELPQPIKHSPYGHEEVGVAEPTLWPSPGKRFTSERFTTATKMAPLPDGNQHSLDPVIGRYNSERRQCLEGRTEFVYSTSRSPMSGQYLNSNNCKSPNVAAVPIASLAKPKPRRHSANFNSFQS